MAEKRKWKVGQTVVLRLNDPRRYGHEREFTIKAIGRKWATLDPVGRFSIEDARLDGGEMGAIGRVYASRADLEADKARESAWGELCAATRNIYRPPDYLELAELKEILRILSGGK